MPKLDGVFRFEGIKPVKGVEGMGFLGVERKKQGSTVHQWE